MNRADGSHEPRRRVIRLPAVSLLRMPARWTQRMGPWHWALVVVIGTYVGWATVTSLRIHNGLGTSAYDSALYDQGLWLMSRFKAPFITLMGRNLFGDHTSFILLPLVPVYWVLPGAGTLFFVQSAAIGLGALPVFLYARRRLESGALAFTLACAYLLHPSLSRTNLENFHPDAFLGVLLGFAIYAALTEKWRTYAVFVVLTLLVKEDASIPIVVLGAWVALQRNMRIGLITVLGSIGYLFAATFLVINLLTGTPTLNTWRIPFGGGRGLITEAVTRPGNVIDHLRSGNRPFYLWQMGLPTGFLFVRSLGIAAIGGVVVVLNILSVFPPQHDINFHYSLVVVPPLALAAVHGLAGIRRKGRAIAVGGIAILAVWSAFLWGTLPLARTPVQYWLPSDPSAEAARAVIEQVPPDAAVSAYHALTPHLAHREHIYMFPNPFKVVSYGRAIFLGQVGPPIEAADDIEYVLLPAILPDNPELPWDDVAVPWSEVSGEFELIDSNDYWQLFRRRFG